MTAKLLQALGAALVLLLVGGAIAGFLVLKDRVKVVVSADAAAIGPDATSLLRDDVQVLTRDFGVLQQALGTNFEQLGNALEERAAGRHAAVQALQQQVAVPGGTYTAAALAEVDGAPQFQTLNGSWQATANGLVLDGAEAVPLALAPDHLRLAAETGTVVLRKVVLQ